MRLECLWYALSHREEFGVWGGLSRNERRKLRGETEVDPLDDDEETEVPL